MGPVSIHPRGAVAGDTFLGGLAEWGACGKYGTRGKENRQKYRHKGFMKTPPSYWAYATLSLSARSGVNSSACNARTPITIQTLSYTVEPIISSQMPLSSGPPCGPIPRIYRDLPQGERISPEGPPPLPCPRPEGRLRASS